MKEEDERIKIRIRRKRADPIRRIYCIFSAENEKLKKLIALGFDSVLYDSGGLTVLQYKENVARNSECTY